MLRGYARRIMGAGACSGWRAPSWPRPRRASRARPRTAKSGCIRVSWRRHGGPERPGAAWL
ncbi:hypothetical protein GLA29479_1143 [Lysobacter antibioticus]|uniref:Uncharacterized protein n=1 Tax=Lysobacter antibioticus TaxID=84531 RepID=A0A0S2FAQ3_LYSAN|nr:hypothetical protein GLA29479_1143 [Lysobacter antibioticus]ALN80631.1 hypothetical protein LA76x_2501 [Lysobacter antibioticus]